jgi:cytidylate kinase
VQMQIAPDAEVIDTTTLTLDQVVARIERLVAARTRA